MYPSDQEAKQLIISIGDKMSRAGFVSANDGNITVRVEDDAVWATPTGVNKGELTEDKLIKIRISDGEVIEGTWKATSEIIMHLNAYRTDNEIMSTAHAHPLNLCILACAGLELDLPSVPAACAISARIPVVPYACPGSLKLAQSIIPYVKKYHVVNLANHGPISWGKSPKEAWYRLEDAEASARLALELVKLGRIRPLNKEQVQEVFTFNHLNITPEATVKEYEGDENQQPAISFSEYLCDLFKK